VDVDLFQPFQRVDGLQQFLQIGQRQVDIERHQIGQPGRVVDVVDHLHYVVRQRFAVGKRDLQQPDQRLHQRLGDQPFFSKFPHHLHLDQGEGRALLQFTQPDPVDPLQGDLVAAARHLLDLGHPADGADIVQPGP